MHNIKPPLCKGRWAAVRLLGGVVTKRAKPADNCKAEALQLRGRAAERVSFRDTSWKRTNEACEDEAQPKHKSRVYKASLGQA